MKSLATWLARADELCGQGLYFEAHEELEKGWMAAAGPEKIALQGAVQLAAGLHRLRLKPDERDGASYLLARGLEKLRRPDSPVDPASVEALAPLLDEFSAGRRPPPDALRLGLRVR